MADLIYRMSITSYSSSKLGRAVAGAKKASGIGEAFDVVNGR